MRSLDSSASRTRSTASASAFSRVSLARWLASELMRLASSSACDWMSPALRSAASTIERTWSAAAVASEAGDGFCWRFSSETESAISRRWRSTSSGSYPRRVAEKSLRSMK